MSNNDNSWGQPPSDNNEPSSYPQSDRSSYGQAPQQGGDYGQQGGDAGQQGGYDQAPQQGGGYGQQGGYGSAPMQQGGGYGQAPQMNNAYTQVQTQGALSSWGKRAGGYAIDALGPVIVYYILIAVGFAISNTLGGLIYVVGGLALLGYVIWNRWILGGNTGQTLGRKQMGTKLIGEQSGQPIGAGMAFVRDLCHFLDSIACYVGWLFPLWDTKRQTFADKIMNTVVIDVPKL